MMTFSGAFAELVARFFSVFFSGGQGAARPN
jgi:hypothetical protein